jgi:hypothetical protein
MTTNYNEPRRKLFAEQRNIFKEILKGDIKNLNEILKKRPYLVDKPHHQENYTPLVLAVTKGNEEIVSILLTHTHSLNNVTNALEQAKKSSDTLNTKIQEMLIDKYKTLQKQNLKPINPKFKPKLYTIQEEIKEELKENKTESSKVNTKSDIIELVPRRFVSAHLKNMYDAIISRDLEKVIQILNKDKNIVDNNYIAVKYINPETKQPEIARETPLTLSMKLNYTEIANIFIKYSKNIENIENALIIASQSPLKNFILPLKTKKQQLIENERKIEAIKVKINLYNKKKEKQILPSISEF